MIYIVRTIIVIKSYGDLKSVSHVSLNIKQGIIYGLLGLKGDDDVA
ncbi:hypothetical protein ACFTRD_21460 [Paenibacillus sp. NPDC056933]